MSTSDGNSEKLPRPRRQHWLPRFYLRHFAIPGTDKIWVFRRERGTLPFMASIKDVCCRKYLYSPRDDDGQRDFHVEQELSNLESLIAPFWQDLNRGFYNYGSEGSKKGMSLFIANLMLRHPSKMAEVKALHQKLVGFYDSCPKDKDGIPNIGCFIYKGEEIPFDRSGWPRYRDAGENDHHRFFVDIVKRDTFHIAEILYRKPWRILISDRPVYVTCDQPVIVSNFDRPTFGISTPGTTIYFPISPTRVLVIDDRIKDDGLYRPDKEHAGASTNFTIWTHTDGYMMSSRPSDHVLEEIVDVYDEYKEIQELKAHRKRSHG